MFTYKNVYDGFYESLVTQKEPDMTFLNNSPSFTETLRNGRHIRELAKLGQAIPAIDAHESVLYSVKQGVNDLFSISASHFFNFGAAGIRLVGS